MSQVPPTRVRGLPNGHVERPWQFSLKSLFVMMALSGFPLMLVSPSFFQAWHRHAMELEPFDHQAAIVFYTISLTFVFAVLFCFISDVMGNAGSGATWADRAGRAPYSHRFAIDYTITAIATPLLFVLAPLDFLRTPRNGLAWFVSIFALVTVTSGIRKWRRRRAAARTDTCDTATSKTELAEAGSPNVDAATDNQEPSIKLHYQVRGEDLLAAQRFLNPLRMRCAIASLMLLLTLAIVIGSVTWAALVCAGSWALGVLALRGRKRRLQADLGEIRISVSESRLVTAEGDSVQFRRWDSLTSYGATRKYLFVFLNIIGPNGKEQCRVFAMPRRELTPTQQLEVEAILEDQLGAGAELIRERRRLRFLRELVILLVLLLFSALILAP